MKKPFFPILLIVCLLITFLSCSNKSKKSRKPVSSIILIPKKTDYTVGDQISVQVKSRLNNGEINKVELYFEDELVASEKSLDFTYNLKSITNIGSNTLKVIVTKTDGLSNTRFMSFSVLSDVKPREYTYEVINEYPHSIDYFTEGLLTHNGFLYESTGQNGTSAIHKIILKTGKVVLQKDLNKQFFGEGITILNDKIYQLTYKSKIGFVYNLQDFALVDSFRTNSEEGWGLTNNGENLIMSDGTNKLTWIDPKTYLPINYLYVASDKSYQNGLNELEFIKGSIFANVWTKNFIVEIDPVSGKILSTTDLSGLYSRLKNKNQVDVLNGIAYIEARDNLLVTGKFWPKLFEIKLKKSE